MATEYKQLKHTAEDIDGAIDIIDSHRFDNACHITMSERSTWNGKVDKVTGKGLSSNDLTDTLKSNYDNAYTNSHVHSNKSVLDSTTASYTTAEKTKLSGIATGATANTGTITGIKMNGESKGTSGVIDLGTVITDVSGKADTSGTYENLTVGKSQGVLVETQTSSTIDSFLDGSAVRVAKISNYSAAGFSGNDGVIISVPWNSSFGMQIAVDDNGDTVATRSKNNTSGWSSWKKIAYKDDIPSFQLDGTTLSITTT